MENEILKHLWALRKMNKALMEGLKLAIFTLEKEKGLAEERKDSIVTSLKDLIAQSEEVYRETAVKR